MLKRAVHCDAEDCKVFKLDIEEMITATITIKATPGYPRVQRTVHACSPIHLGVVATEVAVV